MIRRCFRIFHGIGPGRERAVHAAGIADWQAFLDAGHVPGLSEPRRAALRRQVRRWAAALAEGDTGFFVRNLPLRDHWMLFEALGEAVRHLDIETTGLSARRDDGRAVRRPTLPGARQGPGPDRARARRGAAGLHAAGHLLRQPVRRAVPPPSLLSVGWRVEQFDVIAMKRAVVAESAAGRFRFDVPASRAVLVHLASRD